MSQGTSPAVAFDQSHAAEYDKRFAKIAPIRDALNLLMSAAFSSLPADAHILCVGAGTGAEIIYLADRFPQWQFTAVDPSGPMLNVCKLKTAEAGIASRCTFHEGYLDTLPPSAPFHAATSLLVSHFILDIEARIAFFRGIASRLLPNGSLVNADLSADTQSATYQSLLELWVQTMLVGELTPESIANMRKAYEKDVALLPVNQVADIMESGGFETPLRFYQSILIHAWYAKVKG